MIIRKEKLVFFICPALIAVLGFIVYFNSLGGEFIWDDTALIKDNAYIKSWTKVVNIFTESIGSGASAEINFYRPLQIASYMADYSVWGLNVIGYHLTNILLHVLVALALYWLIFTLYHNNWLSFWAAVLFVVHPVHVEAVAYMSGRADSLAALFILLSLIFYIRRGLSNNRKDLIFMLLSCILALLSKEYAVVIPGLLLLYSHIFKVKLRGKEFLFVLGSVLSYFLLSRWILNITNENISSKATLLQRLPGFFAAVAEYARILILPFNLHMEYGSKLVSFSDPRAILGALFLCLLLSYAFVKKKRGDLISYPLFWYFLLLLPVSNLYPLNAYMAEHWLYLPSMGFFLFMAAVVEPIYRIKKTRFIIVLLLTCITLFYSHLTIKQNTYWKDKISFYKRTLRYSKDSPRIYNNLCKAYIDIGNTQEAIIFCEKAVEIKPDFYPAYQNLGNAYRHVGDVSASLKSYQKAVEINPNLAVAYNGLGLISSDRGNIKEAALFYKKAIELSPKYADAYFNLGNAYGALGRIEEAINFYKAAIGIDPKSAHVEAYYNNLAVMYAATGRNSEAITLYEKILKMKPGYKPAEENIRKIRQSGP